MNRSRWKLWLAAAAAPLLAAGMYVVLVGCAAPRAVASTSMKAVPAVALETAQVSLVAEDRTFKFDPGMLFDVPFRSDCPREPTTINYADAEAGGARRVRVTYPGLPKPLYGVLALCGVRNEFHGSASRSYRIVVPQNYVDATEGGRLSVVFEHYQVGSGTLPAWILWLSRDPIPITEGRIPTTTHTSVSQSPQVQSSGC